MRSYFVGIEYAGKSTLIDLLTEYYHRLKLPTHDDDHFHDSRPNVKPRITCAHVGLPR